MNLLQVEGLTKSYKRGFIPRKTEVLKGLSFSVPAGTVTGFLGANGAGKTTTMRCILGHDYADGGKVDFFGKPLDVEGRRRIGFLPERPYFYEHLSGVEFLEFYANLSGKWKKADLKARIDQLLKRVDLTFAKDRLLRTYSKGMLQKIGLAQALVHEPELVILDEPMSGLDPDGRMALADIIVETAKKGTAVFFTSHLLHDTERLCERLIVIKGGATIYEGSTDALLDRGGVEFEINFVEGGQRKQHKVPTQEQLQPELKRLLAAGATIIEVRRLRPTLEEIFVNMALRGSEARP
ncbi:MAG: ABC transporter ATP-binding protein [Bdellovibrionales bacterium]|nr:ABC transporter ATP-binding protein [Bdellovibrionales bacterium]